MSFLAFACIFGVGHLDSAKFLLLVMLPCHQHLANSGILLGVLKVRGYLHE
jgi:hypothetical protein